MVQENTGLTFDSDASDTDVQELVEELDVDDDEVDEEPEELDYKSLYEQTKAEAERLNNNLKSVQGNVLKQAERDEMLYSMKDEMEALAKANNALIKAYASGDAEGLLGEVEQINTSRSQSGLQARQQAQIQSLTNELRESVNGDGGTPVLDLYQAPELESVRASWDSAMNSGDIASLSLAVAEAHKVVRQAERKAAADAIKAEKARAKRQLDKARQQDSDIAVNGSRSNPASDLSGTAAIQNALASQEGGLKAYIAKRKSG